MNKKYKICFEAVIPVGIGAAYYDSAQRNPICKLEEVKNEDAWQKNEGAITEDPWQQFHQLQEWEKNGKQLIRNVRLFDVTETLVDVTEKESIDGDKAQPTIICLCGSTKFKKEFFHQNFFESMRGKIVLTVGWYSHVNGDIYELTSTEKAMMDKLHLRKIDLADEVFIINKDHYIGESTRQQLTYAYTRFKGSKTKKISFLEMDQFPTYESLFYFIYPKGKENGQ